MTDSEYLAEMIDLTTKLTNACNDFGLRSDEYNAVLKDIAASAARFNRSRWRPSWFTIASICFLFLMLAWVIYTIVRDI
jgi:hypothetical protein